MPKAHANWPVGSRIVRVRTMTYEELREQGWDDVAVKEDGLVIELDDGGRLYPSRDEEGNGPGALFATEPDGRHVTIDIVHESVTYPDPAPCPDTLPLPLGEPCKLNPALRHPVGERCVTEADREAAR